MGLTNDKTTHPDTFLMEVSWEVCNKIGGIYTVLSSKASELQKIYGERMCFIGPDVWTGENPCPVFLERRTLLKNAATRLKLPHGISVRIGRWDIPGQPVAVLVDYRAMDSAMDAVFGRMWEEYKVDSLHGYGDYRESCTFAVAAAIVAEHLSAHLKVSPQALIAHFDEWTTGMGLLHLRSALPQAATVFTTHATSIGRSIAGNGKPLYDYFTAYNGDQMARELNMEAKHSLEKTAAMAADCFTTVSDVTAAECEQLLGIRPQVITPNGFTDKLVPAPRTYAADRKKARARLLETASAITGRFLPPDTFIVATSGRNEYRNKGLDLFIDAMAEAGRTDTSTRPVLALIMVPAWVSVPNDPALQDHPEFVTHRLHNEDSDAVYRRLLELQSSQQQSRTTMLYVPVYLDGHDGVLDLSYYKMLPALDMAVFPSYYEPWGYTPLESVAFGIPTVTASRAGFGQWVRSIDRDSMEKGGVAVVDRNDSDYPQACSAIARCVDTLSALDDTQLLPLREAARATAARASWSLFIKYYQEAYAYALHRAAERNAD